MAPWMKDNMSSLYNKVFAWKIGIFMKKNFTDEKGYPYHTSVGTQNESVWSAR